MSHLFFFFEVQAFVPFIERREPLMKKHVESTVESARVLSWQGIHVAGLHHVHGRGHQGGAESRRKGRREVTRHVICQRRAGEQFKTNKTSKKKQKQSL